MKRSLWKTIWRLHQLHRLSNRAIARRLRCTAKTVAKALRWKQPPPQTRKHRGSILDPYHSQIDSLIARNPNLFAPQVLQAISNGPEGYPGQISLVRRYLRHIRPDYRKRASELKTWLFDIIVSERTLQSIRKELGPIPNLALILDAARHGPPSNRKRELAVLARAKGVSKSMVAACLDVHRSTVREACLANSHDSPNGPFRSRKGAPPTSPEERLNQANALVEILHNKPNAYGINRSNWTRQSLAQAYEKQYGGRMYPQLVRKLLKLKNYSWKKARKVLTSPDPQYREKVELLLKTLHSLKPDEMLFFIDELGPLRVRKYGGKCCTPKNQTPTYPQKQRSKGSITLYAALSATTNQLTWLYGKAKNSAAMIDLAEVLFNQYHDASKIYITWDTASWHRSSELVEWVDALNATNGSNEPGPTIELVPLPTSSQFLNVIESIFSSMAKAVIHGSDYQSDQEMKAAISTHFRERNDFFRENPKRAGNKIWELDFFQDHNNLRWGDYREW